MKNFSFMSFSIGCIFAIIMSYWLIHPQVTYAASADSTATHSPSLRPNSAVISKEESQARADSLKYLSQLEPAYRAFMADHGKRPPETMENIHPYIKSDETYQWLIKNVVLLDKNRMSEPLDDPAVIPIAYDKTLINTQGGSIVLFKDGHLEFIHIHNTKLMGLLRSSDFPDYQPVIGYRNSAEMARMSVRGEVGGEAVQKAIEKLLATNVGVSALAKETTFEKAVDILRNSTTPPLTIIVLWSEMSENAFIEKDTPVQLADENLENIALKEALQKLLKAASDAGFAELGYVIENGVITIGTKKSLPKYFLNKVYDVSDIVDPPAACITGIEDAAVAVEVRQDKRRERMQEIKNTIVESIAPASWFGNGGEGRIEQYKEGKLIIWQSPEIHKGIADFLAKLRMYMTGQVAIETRILLGDDNFLEDIGLEIPSGENEIGQAWKIAVGPANSEQILAALKDRQLPEKEIATQKVLILDDFQSNFIVRATTSHRNAKTLTVPKAIVLNGEPTHHRIIMDQPESPEDPVGGYVSWGSHSWPKAELDYTDIDGKNKSVKKGIFLSVCPFMQKDDSEILLKGQIQLSEALESKTQTVNGKAYEIPEMQVVNIPVYTTVEKDKTVLVVGPDMAVIRKSTEPLPKTKKSPSSRPFNYHSSVKDNQRMLIMIKPTIIEPDEADLEAVKALSPKRD